MKKLIILLCLLATAIIGYQIASALTISSGSLSVSSGSLSVGPAGIRWEAGGNYISWETASGDRILWD